MPDTWSRRTLLASAGVAALAGCLGGDDDPGDTPTETPTDTPEADTATATPTATAEPTPATPDSVDSAWPVPDHDSGRSNYAPGASGPTDPVAQLWTTAVGASLSAPVPV